MFFEEPSNFKQDFKVYFTLCMHVIFKVKRNKNRFGPFQVLKLIFSGLKAIFTTFPRTIKGSLLMVPKRFLNAERTIFLVKEPF